MQIELREHLKSAEFKETKHTESDKSSNDLTAIPSKFITTESECENERDNHAGKENRTNPVDLFNSFPVWLSFLCVEVWNQENEDGRDEATNW